MLKKRFCQIFGITFLVMSIAGLFVSGKLLNFINVDLPIDLIRLAIAAALIYAGFSKISYVRTGIILASVGIIVLMVGIISSIDNDILGLAKSGFTPFDIASHIVIGAASFIIGWNNILPHHDIERTVESSVNK